MCILSKHGVPRGMPVLVIDALEMIYVTHGYRDRSTKTRSPRDLSRIVTREEPSIGDIGKVISRGKAAAFDECAREGVLVLPADPSFPTGSGPAALRLSFGDLDEDTAAEGIRRLARALGRCMG